MAALGTTFYSRWADAFILTWPATLYVAFRTLLAVSVWAGEKPWNLRRRAITALALAVFLALGYGYFQLCAATGFVVAWSFLAGFLPAMPVAAIAAKTRRRWLAALAEVVAFTIYFWSSGMLPMWKDFANGPGD